MKQNPNKCKKQIKSNPTIIFTWQDWSCIHTPFCLYKATDRALIRTLQPLWFRIAKTNQICWKDYSKPLFCFSPFSRWTSIWGFVSCSSPPACYGFPGADLQQPGSPPCCSGTAPTAVSLLDVLAAVPRDGPLQERESWKRSAKPGRATNEDKMPRGPNSFLSGIEHLELWLASLKMSCTIELPVTKTSDGGTWRMSPSSAF